jgi:hypothetical protein
MAQHSKHLDDTINTSIRDVFLNRESSSVSPACFGPVQLPQESFRDGLILIHQPVSVNLEPLDEKLWVGRHLHSAS